MAHGLQHTDSAARLWSIEDLRGEIDRYEEMLRASELSRNTTGRYVEFSERFVNWLDGRYAPRSAPTVSPHGYQVIQSKYEPLRAFLAARDENAVRMSFAQVEHVLGCALPKSARRTSLWWTNNPKVHVQAAAWVRAGRRARRVDLTNERVMFVRAERDLYQR